MPSYPIAFPKVPATERLVLNRRQSATESQFNLAVQVVNTASQWVLEWTWPRMRHAQAEVVRGWLNSLRGQIGTFRYYPRLSRASTLTGRTLVSSAFAYSNTISAQGWSANSASLITVGQLFQIGNQLLTVTAASALADGSGRVTIEFEPAIRVTVAAGQALNFTNPSGVFRLAGSDGGGFTIDPDRAPEFGSMAAREVVT